MALFTTILSESMISAARKRRDARAPRSTAVGPTPERLAKAGEHVVQGISNFRLVDHPIALMRSRQVLDRKDRSRNDILVNACERFYEHWYYGGLTGFPRCGNLARIVPISADLATASLTESERIIDHRNKFNDARGALERAGDAVGRGPRYLLDVAEPVILQEEEIEVVGRGITGYGASLARGAATERLRCAAEVLARHFGMIKR